MKVSPFKSVGAKLFYYMSLLVLITVAGNAYQFGKTFMNYQTQQVQDTLQLQAERAGSQFENSIENWRSQIAVALPTLRNPDSKTSNDQLQRFVDANSEFISLELFSVPDAKSTKFTPLGEAFTTNTGDKSFEDKVPAKVGEKIKSVSLTWLHKQVAKGNKKGNVLIESVAKSVGLPVMLLGVRFEIANSPAAIWAVLATFQNNLIKALPKSKFLDSAVVDAKGKIFTSPNLFDMLNRKAFPGTALVKSATAGSSPAGFEPEYRDKEGRRRLGAFYRLPRYDLAVLVEEDTEAAYLTLKKNLLSTGLWASLFILVSVMFSFWGATGITKGLRAVTYATGRIAAGDMKYQIPPGSHDEVGALGAAVNHMSRKILELLQSQVDKARFEKELETAKMVQSTFFPKQDIKTAATVVTGYYQPASECGGDLWGHYTIDEGVEFVFIADAMGHGAPAALVTAIAYSTTMTVADIIKQEPGFRDNPARILERLNRVIYEAVRGTISMTFFASIIDTNRGQLIYANAGHNFPAILPLNPGDPRAGKASKQSAKSGGVQPISLRLMGTPLGMEANTTYKEQTIDLKAGDKIFYFTDGLIECSSPTGEVWGRKFLLEQVTEAARLSAEEMKNEVVNKALGFFANKPLDDDITVVVAEIARQWQPKQGLPPAAAHEPPPTVVVAAPTPPPVPVPVPAKIAVAAPRTTVPPATLPDPVSMPPFSLAPMTNPWTPSAAPVTAAMSPTPAPVAPQAPQTAPNPPPQGKYKLKLPSTG